MTAQPWICVVIFWLTAFKPTTAPSGTPEEASNDKYIGKEYWRAPAKQSEGSLCDAEIVKLKHPEAHKACAAECVALSKRAELVFAVYGGSRSSAERVSRQCTGFTDGQCKSHFLGYFTTCWCRAKNFSQMSFVCRNLIFDWYRVFINAKTKATTYYKNSIKPKVGLSRSDSRASPSLLGSMRSKVSGVWSSFKSRRSGRQSGGDMMMDDMHMHGQGNEYGDGYDQNYFEPREFDQERWAHGEETPAGLRGAHTPNFEPSGNESDEELYNNILDQLQSGNYDAGPYSQQTDPYSHQTDPYSHHKKPYQSANYQTKRM